MNAIGLSSFILASPFSDADGWAYDRTAEIGYDVIEVCIEDPSVISAEAIAAHAARTGLTVGICGAFGPDRDLSNEDADRRAIGRDYVNGCVDIAASVGSALVAGPMYAQSGQTRMLSPDQRRAQLLRAAESMREVADYAGERGVALAFEPLNRFETDLVNTVEQALELCDVIGRPNVGLLIDSFHMNIEEKNLGAAIRMARDKVFHVQASENDRGAPGSGHVPWDDFFGALSDIDYRGQIVVESFLPTIVEIARAVSLWRPVAASPEEIAVDGYAFLRTHFPPSAQ
jgi:D-psicose/D-tagatose/L-ribulose 3-epimerase